MTHRIRPMETIPTHSDSIMWLNALIIDLKLQALGKRPTRPIDMGRLDEFDKVRRDLEQCERRIKWY